MKKKGWIGKEIDLSLAETRCGDCQILDAQDTDFVDVCGYEHFEQGDEDETPKNQVLEVFISRGDEIDGYNAFSLLILLENGKIKDILRIGHCHMCGGQGSDDVIKRFPSKYLEEEAEGEMTFLTQLQISESEKSGGEDVTSTSSTSYSSVDETDNKSSGLWIDNLVLRKLFKSVLEGYKDEAKKLTLEALSIGIDPNEIYHTAVLEAGYTALNLRVEGSLFMGELGLTSEAMKTSLDILRTKSSAAALRGSKSILFLNLDRSPDILDPVTLVQGFEIMTIIKCLAFSFVEDNFSNIDKMVDYVQNHTVDLIIVVGSPRAVQNTVSALEQVNMRNEVFVAIPGRPMSFGNDRYKSSGVDLYLPIGRDVEDILIKIFNL